MYVLQREVYLIGKWFCYAIKIVKNKKARGISRVLYFSRRHSRVRLPARKSLCHLSSPAVSRRIVSNLPPDSDGQPFGNARCVSASVYMVLQPAVRTAAGVAVGTGGLLPRLFTLTAVLYG